MGRILVLAFVLAGFLSGANLTFGFKETRFLKAFDNEVVKRGYVIFTPKSAAIVYPNELEVTMENDNITIKKDGKTEQKSAKEAPDIAMMFRIFGAIFENDERSLRRFFKITNSSSQMILDTLSPSSQVVKLICTKKDGNITKIETFERSGDRIVIDVDLAK